MAHNDRLLRRICAEDETYLTAQPLLRLAQVRTGPGSGHDLGPHTVGLPAICAYIASKRLKNGDVTRTAAQQASCLKAADFEKAYYIVESVLGGARTKTTAGGELTYEELIKKYKIPMASERLVPWMKKAETKLVQADANLGEKQATRDVIGAVFLWVCSAIKGRKITPLQNFAEENRISLKSLKRIYDTLTTALAEFKAELLEAMKPKPRATSSSPTKRSQTVAGSSLQPIPALQLSPTKRSTSSTKQPLRPLLMKGGSPTKRRVTFSDADMTDETGTVTDGGSEVTPATTDVEMDADTDLDMDGGSVPASLSTLSRGSTMSISTIQDDSEADELFRGGSPTKMSQGDGLSTPRKRGLEEVNYRMTLKRHANLVNEVGSKLQLRQYLHDDIGQFIPISISGMR
ncbi:hypothetical protein AX16_004568 [Volvariella volvacea WC 439]|nr:hypothetical protein AX16_004568 [Volvariella volvacea WC 439]